MKTKHKIERISCVTRQKNDASQMIRIAKLASGEIVIDRARNQGGFGAYLNAEELPLARKKNALARALKTNVPQSVYDELEEIYG